MFGNLFYRKSCLCEVMWKMVVERGRPRMTIWRMHIGYWIPYTLRLCNSYRFSTATMVARARLNVMYYVYIACLVIFSICVLQQICIAKKKLG